jgi:hypothetical protein
MNMIKVDLAVNDTVCQLERTWGLLVCLKTVGLSDEQCINSGYADNIANSEMRVKKVLELATALETEIHKLVPISKITTLRNELKFILNEFELMTEVANEPNDNPSEHYTAFCLGIDGIFVMLFDALKTLDTMPQLDKEAA